MSEQRIDFHGRLDGRKLKTKTEVNAYVRAAMGAETDPVDVALRAIGKVPTDRLAELAALLPADVRAALQ